MHRSGGGGLGGGGGGLGGGGAGGGGAQTRFEVAVHGDTSKLVAPEQTVHDAHVSDVMVPSELHVCEPDDP